MCVYYCCRIYQSVYVLVLFDTLRTEQSMKRLLRIVFLSAALLRYEISRAVLCNLRLVEPLS